MRATWHRAFVRLLSCGGCEMWKDPIIEELHAVRKQLAAECNNDLKAIVLRAMKKQQEHANRLVTPHKASTPLPYSKQA